MNQESKSVIICFEDKYANGLDEPIRITIMTKAEMAERIPELKRKIEFLKQATHDTDDYLIQEACNLVLGCGNWYFAKAYHVDY